MEPISLLVAALAAGANAALRDTASTAVKDAYEGLKGLIARKFGTKASIESLEEKPASAAKQAAVSEDLADAGAAADEEVLAHARVVVEAVERDDPASAAAIGLDLAGIKAEFLKVGDITSAGTGAKLRDSTFTGGITLGNIKAGSTKPPADP